MMSKWLARVAYRFDDGHELPQSTRWVHW